MSRVSLPALALIAAFVAVVVVVVLNFSDARQADNITVTSSSTPAGSESAVPQTREFEIVTLLPFDAIPSIDDPRLLDAQTADNDYAADELVLGVEIDGDARAYSVPTLSRHEIVNDVIGGKAVAVTW